MSDLGRRFPDRYTTAELHAIATRARLANAGGLGDLVEEQRTAVRQRRKSR
jgi:hypothetical protein